MALEDVERALVGYGETRLARDRLADATEAAERSSALARKLCDLGLGEYPDVLDAERTLVGLVGELAVADTGVVLRLISLYKALGGGWQEATTANAPGPDPAPRGQPGDVRRSAHAPG